MYYLDLYVTFAHLGPYTETIDLCFEPFFVIEIMRVIEWLHEINWLTNEE